MAADLVRRDALDHTVTPLVEAPDAFVVDTTGRSVDEIIDLITSRVESGA